jgi:glycerol-3-phosphate cytidylyltransferase
VLKRWYGVDWMTPDINHFHKSTEYNISKHFTITQPLDIPIAPVTLTLNSDKYMKSTDELTREFLLQTIIEMRVSMLYVLHDAYIKYLPYIYFHCVRPIKLNFKIITYVTCESTLPEQLTMCNTVRVANHTLYDKFSVYNIIINSPQTVEYTTAITYGTYDLLHQGHVNLFENSKRICNKLIVGVSTDEFNHTKGKYASEDFNTRISRVNANIHVDESSRETSFDHKQRNVDEHGANLLIMGGDWRDKFDEEVDVPCFYFDRTPNISSTELRATLNMS